MGAVVIGRNEGERLARALEAVRAELDAVVYVDSNSDDGSRERAAALGAEVVHLEHGPFTAARARQRGVETLLARRPELEAVLFLDGDCVVQPGFLARGLAHLDAHPDVAAVTGRRREERPDATLFHRVTDVEWGAPEGDAIYFGGDCLIRVAALREAGGWRAGAICAEDADLSFRLRERCGRIVRLPVEMTLHDVRMERFGQYWRRHERAGYGYAEVGWRFRHGPGRPLLRRVLSAAFYALLLPALALVCAVLWPWGLALLALVYARALGAMARFALRRGAAPGTAAWYALLNLACKPAVARGSLRFALDRLARRGGPRDELVFYR